jgi:general secretion pathway protein E
MCRDTGYLGRRGIYEVLVNSPAVQDEIITRINTRACAKSLSARACRRCASAARARGPRGDHRRGSTARGAGVAD